MGVLSHFFKPGIYIKDSPEFPIETIMDCGANIGDETTRFRIHYPNAEIIAVEADPDNFAILQENVGEDDKITPVLGAVWSIDSELKLSKAGNGNPESSFVAESDGGVRVKSFSIPSLIKLRKWRKIDILKLDVEGAESHIFKADTTWLNCVNCLVFEVPDSDVPGTLQLIFEKLRNQKWNGRTCGECLALVRQELDWNIDTVVGVKH